MTTMQRGKSKALNYAKHRKLSAEQLEQISQDCLELGAVLTPLVKEYQGTQQDVNLSQAGRQAAAADLQEQMVEAVDKINKTNQLEESGERMQVDSFNRLATTRNKYAPGDNVYLAVRLGAIWQGAQNIIDQAKTAHEIKVAEDDKADKLLTDEERAFISPFHAMYLDSCSQGMTGITAEFIQAVENVPFPLSLVEPEVLTQGQAILEAVESPELAASIVANKHRAAAYEILIEAAAEVIGNPMGITLASVDKTLDGIKSKVAGQE